MNKLKVYLAGSVHLNEYREYVKKNYDNNDFEVIDPLDYEEWEVEEQGNHQQIINTDLRLMNYCDVLIADVSLGPSFGTVSEIALMCHMLKKPIFVFNIPKEFDNNPWLIGQATITFKNVDECFKFLKEFKSNKQKFSKSMNKRLYYQTKGE